MFTPASRLSIPPLLPRRLHRLNNLLHHTRITKRTNIPQLILLARQNLPQNPSHNLPAPRLRQIGNTKHGLGSRKRPDRLAHLHDKRLPQLLVLLIAVLNRHKSIHSLACELVVDADDSRFADGVVFDQRRFDLSRAQAVTRNVDDVVHAAADPVVAFGVARGAVAREVVALVDVEVGVHVALVGAPDGAAHAGPGLLEGQDAFDVVAVDFFAGDGVDDRGLDAEEGEGGGAGFGGSDAGEGRDDVGAGFGLPVGL
jgi:hypothetical protein